MRSVVITFPGSNCDRDMAVALELATGVAPMRIWHRESALPAGIDLVAVPGGFSYGDYLRAGAMAARSPIVPAIAAAAEKGVAVLGVCNGFQALTEAKLLPGALMRNAGQTFVCRAARLRVCNTSSPFTRAFRDGEEITIPVAHHDGNYFADEDTLERLEGEERIAFRYVDNVNGSQRAIAGVLNERGNVLGMMPHPERAVEEAHGGTDGLRIFKSVLEAVRAA
jgi:phosphoribosylformylglycinamidine synthase